MIIILYQSSGIGQTINRGQSRRTNITHNSITRNNNNNNTITKNANLGTIHTRLRGKITTSMTRIVQCNRHHQMDT